MMLHFPSEDEHTPYYKGYLSHVKTDNIIKKIKDQTSEITDILGNTDEEKADFRYAENKWSVKEVLGHLTDTERIFGERILRMARFDAQRFLGYDYEEYIKTGQFDERQLSNILEEFDALRKANIILIENNREDALKNIGTVEENRFTLNSFIFIMVGHAEHHLEVLKERYL